MVPQSLAIISAAFPPELRGRAIGTWAGASAITTALGPAVGGFLIDSVRLAGGVLDQPAAGGGGGGARARPRAGEPVAGGRAARLGGRGARGGGGGAAHARADGAGRAGPRRRRRGRRCSRRRALARRRRSWRVERRAEAPLVPLGLFASRAFAGANLMTLFLYGALSGVLFLLPFELIGRRGLGPTEVGLVLLPMGLVIGLLRAAGGRRCPTGSGCGRSWWRGRCWSRCAAAWLAAACRGWRRASWRRCVLLGARHGAGGGAADDGGDERRARRAGRRRLGRQQRREPARRALRRGADRRGRGARLRRAGGRAGGALRRASRPTTDCRRSPRPSPRA